MARPKPTIDDKIEAILARDEGIPYPDVLVNFDLLPNQFYAAVRDLGELITFSRGAAKERLREISADPLRKRELFNMGEECIREQYDRLQDGSQKKIYQGTYSHPSNVEAFVYHALTVHNSKLSSTDRAEVVCTIKDLPSNLEDYFHEIGLRGLMGLAFEQGKQNSPLAVLEVFDRVYQKRTGDVSLFDLTPQLHLHRWGDNFKAPMSYWHDPANIEEAIYHILTENNPSLASTNRAVVIAAFKALPTGLTKYFKQIGIGGLMNCAFGPGRQSSPLAVLEVFDRVYQKRTGDVSLFDLTPQLHLHRWGDNFKAPMSYWHDPANVEEAIYHTLTENVPKLASPNREDIITALKALPAELKKYFKQIGMGGLIDCAFGPGRQSSPLAVLEVFDRVYMRIMGDASLFDKTRGSYLEFDNNGRLVR